MGQGLHMGGGQGDQRQTDRVGPEPVYTGPTIDPASLIDANGFVSQQAYIDAAYIMIHSDVTATVYGSAPQTTVNAVINGAAYSSKIAGQDNGLPAPYSMDFAKYPPSAPAVAAVASATQYQAALKTWKHPDPSIRQQFTQPNGQPNFKAILQAMQAKK